ncbi:MAG: hypothetical protein AAGG75_07550 [Bacteroidota bacterium]
MQNSLFSLLIIAFGVIVFSSCSKQEEATIQQATLTEEETIEVVQQALGSSSYGMLMQAEEAAVMADEELSASILPCGVRYDTTIVRANDPQAVRNYNYVINRSFELICNFGVPQEIIVSKTSSGQYTAPRMSSDDSSTFNASISNLLFGQAYIYNGSYTRQGTQTINIRAEKNFESDLTIQTTGLLINKATRKVVGGSSTFSLTGTNTEGQPFSYVGSITYNGNGSATLEINGNVYNLQL